MIDCHLHLQDLRLAHETESILATARMLGIETLVVNGTEPEDWEAVESLGERYAEVIPFFGLHPWRVRSAGSNWLDEMESRLKRVESAGVGEIGLDRWIRDADPVRQREAFEAQLDLSRRLNRPVAVHCLQAWGSLLESLRRAGLKRGPLLHSYGGPREMVDEFVAEGAYFSISGYFFRPEKAEKLAAFERVPRDRLLIESDAPDMLPPPDMVRYRVASCEAESINHPANLAVIYETVASHLSLSVEETDTMLRRNFQEWYFGAK